eukprot:8816617-Prorocentrum_lima.AAC.1
MIIRVKSGLPAGAIFHLGNLLTEVLDDCPILTCLLVTLDPPHHGGAGVPQAPPTWLPLSMLIAPSPPLQQ